MEQILMVNPRSLVVDKNSRFRTDSNLAELMESIKQNGILQPITAKAEDKKVICGNRRLAAAIKLNLPLVPVRFLPNISDKQLLILNLMENMQRKDISSIEIGRQVHEMLINKEFKINLSEIAVALGISQSRVKHCLEAFKSLPEKFRDKIVHLASGQERKYGELPENVITLILNFSRFYQKIDDRELEKFLQTASDEKLTTSQINLIGILCSQGMPFKQALKDVFKYTIMRTNLISLKTELASVQKKEGIHSKQELVKKIVKDKYPSLLF